MKSIKAILPFVAGLLLLFASCKTKNNVDLGKKPILTFKEADGYIFKSDTVKVNEVVKVGVAIDNQGAADPLNKLYVMKVNGQDDFTLMKEIDISDDHAYSYADDIKFTFNTAGARTFKFKVNNTHGVESEKNITFTVVE